MNRYVQYFFSALVIIVPLFFATNTSELFELNKMYFVYAMSICTIFFITFSNKIKVYHFFIYVPIILWVLSNLISTLFSIDITSSIYGYYGRFNGSLISILAFATLFITYTIFGSKELTNKLINISIVIAVIVVVYGLPGVFGKDMTCLLITSHASNSCWSSDFKPELRMFSTIGQPNWLASYLVVQAFFTLYILLESYLVSKTKRVILFTIFFGIIIAGIFLTKSKSAIYSFITLFFISSFITAFTFRKTIRILFFILFGSIVIGFFTQTGIDKIDTLYSNIKSNFLANKQQTKINFDLRSNNITDNNKDLSITDSLSIRKIVWKGAWEAYIKKPLFGYGPETFFIIYYAFRPISHNYTSEWDFLYNKAHNEFLQIAVGNGTFGLVTYLICIVSIILFTYRFTNKLENRLFIIFSLSAFISIVTTNFFGFSTSTTQLYLYLIPAFILTYFLHKKTVITLPSYIKYVSVLISIFLLSNVFNMYRADILYAQAEREEMIEDYSAAIKSYSEAIKIFYHPSYLEKYTDLLSKIAVSIDDDNSSVDKENIINTTNMLLKVTVNDYPNNIWLLKSSMKNMILLYNATSDEKYIALMLELYKRLSLKSTTDPRNHYFAAIGLNSAWKNTNDVEKKALWESEIIKILDIAIALKSDYRNALFAKAQSLVNIETKESSQEAQIILEKIVKKDSTDVQARELLNIVIESLK